MDERRKEHRWPAAGYNQKMDSNEYADFSVIDKEINRPIGQLIDISAEGMRLLCQDPVEKGTILKLRIDLPEEVKGSDQLDVETRCLWCRYDEVQGQNQIGFEFLSTFPHHAEIIELLFRNCAPVSGTEQSVRT